MQPQMKKMAESYLIVKMGVPLNYHLAIQVQSQGSVPASFLLSRAKCLLAQIGPSYRLINQNTR